MTLAAIEETPLDRNLREIDEAFANWKHAVRNCRDGEATPEDVKRFALALYELMNELRDVVPYSENS